MTKTYLTNKGIISELQVLTKEINNVYKNKKQYTTEGKKKIEELDSIRTELSTLMRNRVNKSLF